MKDFKFDKIKNYQVSDEWADRVIDTVSSVPPAPPYKKIVISCISVLCVGIVTASFLHFSLRTPTPTSIVVQETKCGETVVSIQPTQVVQEPTECATAQKETIQVDASQPAVVVQENTKPIQKPVAPTVAPTQDKTVAPTVAPTQTDVVIPTTPTVPQEPTEDVTTPVHNGDCIVSFSPSYLVGSGNIYCRVRDKDKQTVGDHNLFSDQHLASFYSGFGSTYQYIYSPSSAGLYLESGIYYYYFYNEHGVPILDVEVIVG